MPTHVILDASADASGAILATPGKMPHLALLLARGEAVSGIKASFDAEVMSRFTCEDHAQAALCAAGEGLDPSERYWLRADPIHLAPTRTRLTLANFADGEIAPHDARALCAALNEYFPEFEGSLRAVHPNRWYLPLRDAQRLDTRAPAACLGELDENHLPRGADSAKWKRIMTEAQILLSTHALNVAREAAGQRLVNGIWFWGGGHAPRVPHQAGVALWSNLLHVRGLGRLADMHTAALAIEAPLDLPALGAAQRALVVAATDASSADALQALDRNWFEVLYRGLREGELDALHFSVYLPDRVLSRRLDRKLLKRWWARPRRLLPHA